jgi:hypothetical protein
MAEAQLTERAWAALSELKRVRQSIASRVATAHREMSFIEVLL